MSALGQAGGEGTLRLFGGILLVALLGAGQARAEDVRAHLPVEESASEFFSLTGRFDSGHFLFVELAISNLGVGDRNAAVVGHLLDPDGQIHSFRKARRENDWQLSGDGLRIELGPLLLDRRGPVHHFRLDRKRLKIDLAFRPRGPSASAPGAGGREQGLTLVHAAAPTEGTLWSEGMRAPAATRGRLALTHRWSRRLESRLVQRRIEFFSLDDATGLYLLESLTPKGSADRWLVLERHGRIVRRWSDVETSLEWEGRERGGFALPSAVRFEASGVSGRIALGPLLVRYDPLRELPGPLRMMLSPFIRWRVAWSTSPFELTFEDPGGERRHLAGTGLANVTYFNPQKPRELAGQPGPVGR